MRPASSLFSAELFNCCTALKETDWSRFTTLEAADEGADCIEGGYSPKEASFFTIYGHLKEGGCEAITDCPDSNSASRVASQLCALSGLTLEIVC
ncbi:hypothetical protein AGR4B_pAt20443 [Agrobacterium tumefaciens str. CFBP 5621]|jgi:hypothetical protein|nr:hypothetical protein AGR4B_pAt20443 [Agrobacterium tumefaciens str. CFBP 5621]